MSLFFKSAPKYLAVKSHDVCSSLQNDQEKTLKRQKQREKESKHSKMLKVES